MMDESRRIARGYPLRVRDIGVVGSDPVVARANWDILEVRDVHGELVMRAEVPGSNALLFHPCMRFARGRYLIVEIGGGVSAAGFRVWDFAEERWTMTVDDHWDDVSLVGVDAKRGLAAASDGRGTDVFDVTTGQLAWSLPVCSPATVDFNPDDPERVVVGGDAFLFGAGEVPGASRAALFVRSQLARQQASSVLTYDGPELAWLDAEHIVKLSPAGELELLDTDLNTLRMLGTFPGAFSYARTAQARWVTLHGESETTLIDTTGQLPPRTTRGYLAVMPGGEGAIVADTNSTLLERW